MENEILNFYHAPNSRSAAVRILLEELGCDYKLHVLNLKRNDQRKPEYLSVNPMGKVPAIMHGNNLITEKVAIFIYLADAFAQKKLAPATGDALRGPYLRWMIYYAASFEPALMDRACKQEKEPRLSAYGHYDTMLKTLTDQLEKGPYILGERFTAADIMWGSVLTWTTMFKLVPEIPVIMQYIKRHAERVSVKKATEEDAKLAAIQEKESQEVKE